MEADMARRDVNGWCSDGEVQQLADDFWMVGRESPLPYQQSAAEDEPKTRQQPSPALLARSPQASGSFAPVSAIGTTNMPALNPKALAAWVLGSLDRAR
jgi:hypothetical protein